MQVDGAFACDRCRDRRIRHRHQCHDALRGLGVGDLRHLAVTDQVGLERALPLFVGIGHIQLAALQQRVEQGRFLQLQHQMLALHQKKPELGPVLFWCSF